MDSLHDSRTDSYSIILTLPTKDYLEMITAAHKRRGAIAGQRDVLTTTTAKRIRDRMVLDIRAGAVLPAVVLGVVADDDFLTWLKIDETTDSKTFLEKIVRHDLSIIDGMQRTGSLFEAVEAESSVLSHLMRVEFWIAQSVRSLVYRMLVLNTGQIPWTLARQLSVVYTPLLDEIKKNVPNLGRLFTPDKPGRRAAGGEYGADSIVELYLAFSLRKSNVDTRESLSEEFSRLDFVQNLSEEGFQQQFYDSLSILVKLDVCFDRYEGESRLRLSRGRAIFGSQPARIGFIVALAQYIVGRPGLDRSSETRVQRMADVEKDSSILIEKLNGMTTDELGVFLKLDVLSEILDKRVGQVGRYERGVFQEAFKVLIEERFSVPTMEACWRAA
jgi:hypothetical protein